ncbi:MAG: arginine biosynthesis protein ArgJ [Myxococcales bacterium]|nr:arginine biosynthesis protein ArgJ [Myxococcales bacterium]
MSGNQAKGFRFAGIHAGIKVQRKDLALIQSTPPANAAAIFTSNPVHASCIDRGQKLLPASGIHAVVIASGNANAMTGPAGIEADERLAREVASRLDCTPESVITSFTGSIGVPFPIDVASSQISALAAALQDDPGDAAEAILTTDKAIKSTERTVTIGDKTVHLTAIAKGSGMIHPNMATMLGYICTDADCSPDELRSILQSANASTFSQVSVDRDTSTNDMVVLLANGASGVQVDSQTTAFVDAVHSICEELAKMIAADGEGATRLVSLQVCGAPDLDTARALSRSTITSSLFKCSVFGDMSGAGRCVAAVGAEAARLGIALDLTKLNLYVNDVLEVEGGVPTGRSATLKGPEVTYTVQLGLGEYDAWAWGCDMSYGYVSINAVSKSEPLETHSPGLKRRLLVEALSYIQKFVGRIAVIRYGGASMIREDLKDAFAEDLVLLQAAGLRPVVVHGGENDISETLRRMGKATHQLAESDKSETEDIKVLEMVMTGSVNTDLVTRIQRLGGQAIGLSGKDGNLIQARPLNSSNPDARQGDVESVRGEMIGMLLEQNYIPVISPIGLDEKGDTYNISADKVSSAVAVAIEAFKLLHMTDVTGIFDGANILHQATPDQLKDLLSKGIIIGGMGRKVRTILDALESGVVSAHVIDGRVHHNLLAELFTDKGVGTWIKAPQ